jgi:hypothetical protein
MRAVQRGVTRWNTNNQMPGKKILQRLRLKSEDLERHALPATRILMR